VSGALLNSAFRFSLDLSNHFGEERSAYAIKTAEVLIGANALGPFLYRLGSRGGSRSNAR